MDLLSVIVPVYNAEDYLKRSIESLLKQTYSEIEIILVDDGSKDSSPKICDEYASKDDRIVVVHKKNQGVSKARNYGLDIAKGKYVCFMDSDDYYTEDAFEKMMKTDFDKYDLAVAKYDMVNDGKILSSCQINETKAIGLAEFVSYLYDEKSSFIFGAVWNKIFKMDIIKEHSVHFEESIALCEDMIYLFDYLKYSNKKVFVHNVSTYGYEQSNQNSLLSMKRDKGKSWIDRKEAYKRGSKFICDNDISDECMTGYANIFMYDVVFRIKEIVLEYKKYGKVKQKIEEFCNEKEIKDILKNCNKVNYRMADVTEKLLNKKKYGITAVIYILRSKIMGQKC